LSTKNTLALGTLVAAVPAAALGFFLVWSFLKQLDPLQKQGTMYLALYGTTLAACAAMVFLPFGVLIFGPRSARKPEGAPKSGTPAKAPPTSAEQAVAEEGSESLVDEESAAPKKSSRAMSTGELEVVEATPSMEDLAAYDDEAVPPSGEIAAMEEDFSFEDEEPEPPKKTKGK
jgi:hypothetical protein